MKKVLLILPTVILVMFGMQEIKPAQATAPAFINTLKADTNTINQSPTRLITLSYNFKNASSAEIIIKSDGDTDRKIIIGTKDTLDDSNEYSGVIKINTTNSIWKTNKEHTLTFLTSGTNKVSPPIKIFIYEQLPYIDEIGFAINNSQDTKKIIERRRGDTTNSNNLKISYNIFAAKVVALIDGRTEIVLASSTIQSELRGTSTINLDQKIGTSYLFLNGKHNITIKSYGVNEKVITLSKKTYSLKVFEKPTFIIENGIMPANGTSFSQDSKKTGVVSSSYTTAKDRINIQYTTKNVTNMCVVIDDDETNCFKNINIPSPSGEKKYASIDTDYIAPGIHNIYIKACNDTYCINTAGDARLITIKGSGPIIDSFKYYITNDTTKTSYITDGKYRGEKITLSYGIRNVRSLGIKIFDANGVEKAATTTPIASPYNKVLTFAYINSLIPATAAGTQFSIKLRALDSAGKEAIATLNITNNADKTLKILKP